MSGVAGIGNASYSNYNYGNFASGKKINSAADGAAELTIIEKQDAQVRGYKKGSENIGAGKDLLNVADGAMSGIGDYLQRMRELAVQASNSAVVSDSDRAKIQSEIDQLKQGISDIASNTTFNTKPLLDGSTGDLNIVTDGNGAGTKVSTGDATLNALGIADFDVTGSFDISAIDKALESVNTSRSSMGAQSNGLDYAYNYNSNAMLNTTGAKSRLEDLDFPEAISEKKKQETLQEYALFMQKKKQEEEANRMHQMFA